MAEYTIPRSQKGLETGIIASGLGIALVCGLVTLIFTVFIHMRGPAKLVLLSVLWIAMIIFWVIGVFLATKKWAKTAYVLAPDSLILKRGQMFGVRQELYRYDSILSVGVAQSYLGERRGYGTLTIEIPRVSLTPHTHLLCPRAGKAGPGD